MIRRVTVPMIACSKKAVHLAEREDGGVMKFAMSLMGMVMKIRSIRRKMMRGIIIWSRNSC